jgi:hypothetical protein
METANGMNQEMILSDQSLVTTGVLISDLSALSGSYGLRDYGP